MPDTTGGQRRCLPGRCFRCGLHLLQNRFPDQTGERRHHSPIDAELPQCCRPEALDPGLGRKNRGYWLRLGPCCPQRKIPRGLGESHPGKIDEISCREIHAAAAVRTPELSRNSDHQFVIWNFVQDDEARALKPLTQIARRAMTRHSFPGSQGQQQVRQPQFTEVRV